MTSASQAEKQPRLWKPSIEIGGQAGAENSGFVEAFAPLSQDGDGMVFLDLRIDHGANSRGSASLGFGYRQIVAPDLIIGVNAFGDMVRTDNGSSLFGVTLGVEAFTSVFDFHVNGYLPFGGAQQISSATTPYGMDVVNNRLVERFSHVFRSEALLYGLSGEVGARFESPFGEDQELRTYVGGYYYDRAGFGAQAGTRLGLEYQFRNALGIAGSRLTMGAQLVYDKHDGLDGIASARLRIPFSAGEAEEADDPRHLMTPIQERMDDRVRRDHGIRSGTRISTGVSSGHPLLNPDTGRAYGGVYYASSTGSGTGDFASPTSLDMAIANAGTDGIVVVLGGGTITTPGVTLLAGQVLTGGGESIAVQTSSGSTANFLLSGTNGTIDGNAGSTTVTLANGATIRDLTLLGGDTVIGGTDVTGATLANLSIQDAVDGVRLINATDTTLTDLDFNDITGTNIYLNNHAATLTNITIDGGVNGISIDNNTGTTTLSSINISNLDGDALSFSANSGIINVADFTASTIGFDAVVIKGAGTFGFTGATTISDLGTDATSDGFDLTGTTGANITTGDIDITRFGGGTGLNLAGGDATVTMASLDVSGTNESGSRGIDLSGTQNGRTVTVTDGGVIADVDTGIVLGTNGVAGAAPSAGFTFGGGSIGGDTHALDGIGVDAGNGNYAFGTTTFSGGFNFNYSGSQNYYVAATATGSADGSSADDRASIATAIADAPEEGATNFILINDGSAIDTSGLTFALADNQTVNTFGGGRTFTDAGYVIPLNLTGDNLPAVSATVSDPTGKGAATLTNSSGAVATLALANGNSVNNITIDSTDGRAISGNGFAGLTIEGVSALAGISLEDGSGSITLKNLDIAKSLALTNIAGTLTASDVDISGTNSLLVVGGNAAITFDADSSVTNTGGFAVSVANRSGGSLTYQGAITSNGATASGISIADATAANNVMFSGPVSLGSTTALGGDGVRIDNNGQNATTAFLGGLQIASTSGTAFSAVNGGTISVTGSGNTIATQEPTSGADDAGAAIAMNGVSIGASGMNFATISAMNVDSATDALSFNAVTGPGTFTSNGTTVTGGRTGLKIAGSSASFTFDGTTGLSNSGGNLVTLDGTSGTIDFATLSLTNPGTAAVDVNGTVTGPVSVTDLDIALANDYAVGVDLSGATVNGNFAATDFDATSTSQTGTIAINLAGTTGTGTITLGDSAAAGANATIAGAGGNKAGSQTGVLFSSTTNVAFIFGDGESTTDTGSSIMAVTPLNAIDSLPVNGSYNFLDTTLTGDTSALAGASYYVVDTANNSGSGTFADPGSVDGAEASTADVIVLIDTTVDNASTSLYIASASIDLDQDQILTALVASETFDPSAYGLSSGAPASFKLTGSFAGGISAPNDGSIDTTYATILSNAAATINMHTAGGSVVDNVWATNNNMNANSAVVRGANVNGAVTVVNSRFAQSGNGHGIYLSQSSGATYWTTFSIENNEIVTGTTLNDHAGVTIESSATSSLGVMSGTISDNSFTGGHYGIYIHQQSNFDSRTVVTIANNTISNTRNGIFVDQEGEGRADVTITDNMVYAPLDVVSNGVLFFVGNATSPTVCANVTGNTLASGTSGNSIYFDTYPSTSVILPGYTGGSSSEGNVRTYLNDNNTETVNGSDIFLDSGATAVDDTCTVPSP